MNVMKRALAWAGLGAAEAQSQAEASAAQAPAPASAPVRAVEAAGAQVEDDEAGWLRLTGDYTSNRKDLEPLAQDRMQRLAEWLWQSNLLANRLVELMLAYLLAEGVTLQCKDEEHQKLLNAFWLDPINNFPLKLEARCRALGLTGEQCYKVSINEGSGFVRLGYIDPCNIATVVMDPDNPEQPIGVVTRRDAKGRHHKYRVIVLGEEDVFSLRTQGIREKDFTDGECFLYQVNKLPSGTRGRSDLLAQMDWLDAYDDFLFGEFDRARYLRAFVWDLKITGATADTVKARAKDFKPPEPNSTYVHNDAEELNPKAPELQATDSTAFARMFRNHVLGGATVPEHWFGGGGDVNRAAASEMGEPTFKVYTQRQSFLKLMLQDMGRFVLWKSAKTSGLPDWTDERWQVKAVFPELVNRDVTKFAAAMQSVTAAVTTLVDKGLLSEERALALVADIAQRFGQEIDAKSEILAARKEKADRDKARAAADVFSTPPDLLNAQAGAPGGGPPAAAVKAGAAAATGA